MLGDGGHWATARCKAVELMESSSNVKGGIDKIRDQAEDVVKAVKKLKDSRLQERARQLLETMVLPPAQSSEFGKGTFLAKTPRQWLA